jgi:hypothetical protein
MITKSHLHAKKLGFEIDLRGILDKLNIKYTETKLIIR